MLVEKGWYSQFFPSNPVLAFFAILVFLGMVPKCQQQSIDGRTNYSSLHRWEALSTLAFLETKEFLPLQQLPFLESSSVPTAETVD
jgi:hypothetical protein